MAGIHQAQQEDVVSHALVDVTQRLWNGSEHSSRGPVQMLTMTEQYRKNDIDDALLRDMRQVAKGIGKKRTRFPTSADQLHEALNSHPSKTTG